MVAVKIFGGGIAGLTVAHELACRPGFEITVYEPREAAGGKARSQYGGGLPGEHGFRFFPGWYLHVGDIMRRIPQQPERTNRAESLTGYAEQQSVLSQLREVRHTTTYRRGVAPESFLQIPETILDLPEYLRGFEWMVEGLSPIDKLRTLKRLAVKLLMFYSTPPWLRAGRFDDDSLARYLGADTLPAAVVTALKTVPKALVAMDAFEGSAHTFLNASMLNLAPSWKRELPKDRVLVGPTSQTWIEPWVASLRALGVRFVFGPEGEATRVVVRGGRVAAVETRGAGVVEGEAIVLAMPVDGLQRIVRGSGLAAHGDDFERIDAVDLARQTSEMVGLQLYLNRPLTTKLGHLFFPDSQYGLTAISQMEVWSEPYLKPLRDKGVLGVLSVDITQWDSDPFGRDEPPQPLPLDIETSAALRDAVSAQLAEYQTLSGEPLLRAEWVVAHHVDEDVDLESEANRSELLVHPPGTWSRRPVAKTSLPGLWLASDFCKNPADLATMEGACSAGKLAARGILEAESPASGEPDPAGDSGVTVFELVEELQPSWMAAQQEGFEALVQVLGGFDRVEGALERLLDAGDAAAGLLGKISRRGEADVGESPAAGSWLSRLGAHLPCLGRRPAAGGATASSAPDSPEALYSAVRHVSEALRRGS